MNIGDRLAAAALISLLAPVAIAGFVLVCIVAVVKTLFASEQKDPDFWQD